MLAMPVAAQVAIEAAVQTDYRVRGYSVSDGEPTASVSVSYDDPAGFYLGGLAIGRIRDGDPVGDWLASEKEIDEMLARG